MAVELRGLRPDLPLAPVPHHPAERAFGGEITTPEPEPLKAEKPPKPERLVALDAFRGLTIFLMLLVNNIALGAHTPAQLMHAEWSGAVHIADVVFPWFLFIVGVAVPYAAASARRKRLPRFQYDLKAVTRALMLVGLGCLIASVMARRPVFELGVLQLIGLAYLCAVVVGGLFGLTGRLVLAATLLAGYAGFLHFAPAPGVGASVFTEQTNVVKYINETYLGHYGLKGLISVIPTTAMVLIGTAVGDLLRRKKIAPLAKVGVLLICGAGMVAGGLLWSHALPMNKPLWTPSYIVYTGGLGCITLGLMYLLIDVVPGNVGRFAAFPLIVFGMNAISAYVGPILLKLAVLQRVFIVLPNGKPGNLEQATQQWFYDSAGRINGGWLYTFSYIAVTWLVLLFLYKRRWFLRV